MTNLRRKPLSLSIASGITVKANYDYHTQREKDRLQAEEAAAAAAQLPPPAECADPRFLLLSGLKLRAYQAASALARKLRQWRGLS